MQPDAIPAAEPPAAEAPVTEAPVMDASAAQPALAAAPVRKPRGKVPVLAGVILCLLALGLLLPRLLPKPAAEITVGSLSPIAYPEKDDAFGKDSVGWSVVFPFENVSDVPFAPSQVIVRFYENDRIDDKIPSANQGGCYPAQ